MVPALSFAPASASVAGITETTYNYRGPVYEFIDVIVGKGNSTIVNVAFSGNTTLPINLSSTAFEKCQSFLFVVTKGFYPHRYRKFWPRPPVQAPPGGLLRLVFVDVEENESKQLARDIADMFRTAYGIRLVPFFYSYAMQSKRAIVVFLAPPNNVTPVFDEYVDEWVGYSPEGGLSTLLNASFIKQLNVCAVLMFGVKRRSSGFSPFDVKFAMSFINPEGLIFNGENFTLSLKHLLNSPSNANIVPHPDSIFSAIKIRIPFVGNILYYEPEPDNKFPEVTGEFDYILQVFKKRSGFLAGKNQTGADDIEIVFDLNYTILAEYPVLMTKMFIEGDAPIHLTNGSSVNIAIEIENVGNAPANNVVVAIPVPVNPFKMEEVLGFLFLWNNLTTGGVLSTDFELITDPFEVFNKTGIFAVALVAEYDGQLKVNESIRFWMNFTSMPTLNASFKLFNFSFGCRVSYEYEGKRFYALSNGLTFYVWEKINGTAPILVTTLEPVNINGTLNKTIFTNPTSLRAGDNYTLRLTIMNLGDANATIDGIEIYHSIVKDLRLGKGWILDRPRAFRVLNSTQIASMCNISGPVVIEPGGNISLLINGTAVTRVGLHPVFTVVRYSYELSGETVHTWTHSNTILGFVFPPIERINLTSCPKPFPEPEIVIDKNVDINYNNVTVHLNVTNMGDDTAVLTIVEYTSCGDIIAGDVTEWSEGILEKGKMLWPTEEGWSVMKFVRVRHVVLEPGESFTMTYWYVINVTGPTEIIVPATVVLYVSRYSLMRVNVTTSEARVAEESGMKSLEETYSTKGLMNILSLPTSTIMQGEETENSWVVYSNALVEVVEPTPTGKAAPTPTQVPWRLIGLVIGIVVIAVVIAIFMRRRRF